MNKETREVLLKTMVILRELSENSLKKGEELKSEFHTGQGIGLMRAIMYIEDEFELREGGEEQCMCL